MENWRRYSKVPFAGAGVELAAKSNTQYWLVFWQWLQVSSFSAGSGLRTSDVGPYPCTNTQAHWSVAPDALPPPSQLLRHTPPKSQFAGRSCRWSYWVHAPQRKRVHYPELFRDHRHLKRHACSHGRLDHSGLPDFSKQSAYFFPHHFAHGPVFYGGGLRRYWPKKAEWWWRPSNWHHMHLHSSEIRGDRADTDGDAPHQNSFQYLHLQISPLPGAPDTQISWLPHRGADPHWFHRPLFLEWRLVRWRRGVGNGWSG